MKRTADELAALMRLLDEALELPASDRQVWIESLEEQHAPLRDTLRRLLSHAEARETDSFVDFGSRIARIVDAQLEFSDTELHAGVAIGPYRLERELGKGGMGSVWLAQRADGAFSRTVAIKLPRMVWIDDVAARMARERDILASLQHEHIARFYDAGVDRAGRPYIAMEYVPGEPITEYIRARALTIDEILKLILQVCQALAHAHSRLIVHRDLKPGNILVSEEYGVRLLDFGIAALLSEERGVPVTQFAGQLLTLEYSSPEQIRAEPIGTASDIYSLAVVSYELLTGRRPYELGPGSIAQAAKVILETEPRPASEVADPSRRSRLRGDIDAVLNKALKKNPAERYASITEIADDIDRHLRHIPVRARPDRFAYRARKFLGRYRWQVSAAALVFTAVAAGAGVALWQAHLARIEAARADLVKDFALSIFDGADIDAGNNGAATTAKDLLLVARQRAEHELDTRPDVAVELMTSIAYALIGQNESNAALDLSKRAIERASATLGPQHPLTLSAMVVEGEALEDIGHSAEAEVVLTRVIDPARRQRLTITLVNALRWLGSAQLELGKYTQAVSNTRLAVANLPAQTNTRPLQELAEDTWAGLANVLLYLELPGAAEPALRAVEMRERLNAGRQSEAQIIGRGLYAEALVADGRPSAAVELLEQTVLEARQFLGPRHPTLEYSLWRLGSARSETGDLPKALEAFGAALDIGLSNSSPDDDRSGKSRFHVALGLSLEHRDSEALAQLDTAIGSLDKQSGSDSSASKRARALRALILARLDRLSEAEQELVKLRTDPLHGIDGAIFGIQDASVRIRQDRPDEAVALAKQSLSDLRPLTDVTSIADANRVLGAALLATGRVKEARGALQEAVRLYSGRQLTPTPDHLEAVALLERARAPVSRPGH